MINKLKKLLNMDKKIPTNEEVFEAQIQAREESEAAADNIDAVVDPKSIEELDKLEDQTFL